MVIALFYPYLFVRVIYVYHWFILTFLYELSMYITGLSLPFCTSYLCISLVYPYLFVRVIYEYDWFSAKERKNGAVKSISNDDVAKGYGLHRTDRVREIERERE